MRYPPAPYHPVPELPHDSGSIRALRRFRTPGSAEQRESRNGSLIPRYRKQFIGKNYCAQGLAPCSRRYLIHTALGCLLTFWYFLPTWIPSPSKLRDGRNLNALVCQRAGPAARKERALGHFNSRNTYKRIPGSEECTRLDIDLQERRSRMPQESFRPGQIR